MSIEAEITRLVEAKQELAQWVEGKGVQLPSGATLDVIVDNLPNIQTGGYSGDLYVYGTRTVAPASGVYSVSFSDIPKEPDFFVVYLDSADVNQYYRAGVVVYDGDAVYGQELYSTSDVTDDVYFHMNVNSASDYYWRYTYSGTTLTITSYNENKGGYFHNPGTYTLLFAYKDNVNGTVAIEKRKVVSGGGTSLAFHGVEAAPVWFSAIMRGNQDAQAASSNTVVFANKTGYAHLTNSDVADFAYVAASNHYSFSGKTLTLSAGADVFASNEYALIYAYTPDLSGREDIALETRTVTPGKQQQDITPNDGYDGLSKVTVEAIPSEFQDVSGVTAAAADVLSGKRYVNASGALVTGTMVNRGAVNKTLDATNNNQSYTVPAGYHNGSGKVQISLETKSVTPTKSAQTITPTSGKVLSQVIVAAIPAAYQNVSSVTATAPDVVAGKKFVNASGTVITGTLADGDGVSY